MRKKTKGLFDWIDKKDPTQTEWALSYLKKNDYDISSKPHETVFQRIENVGLKALPDPLLIEKMKKAWNAKRTRDRRTAPTARQQKAIQVYLSTEAIKKLNEICEITNNTRGSYLEKIIFHHISEINPYIIKLKETKTQHAKKEDRLKSQLNDLKEEHAIAIAEYTDRERIMSLQIEQRKIEIKDLNTQLLEYQNTAHNNNLLKPGAKPGT